MQVKIYSDVQLCTKWSPNCLGRHSQIAVTCFQSISIYLSSVTTSAQKAPAGRIKLFAIS